MSSSSFIKEARLLLYTLSRSFFDFSPNEEKIRMWKEIMDEMSSGLGFPPLDKPIKELSERLQTMNPDEIGEEFYQLFENPFNMEKVYLNASYYADGRPFGQTLVNLRRLLYNLQLGRSEFFKETEDNLIYLLDLMAHLIHNEKEDQVGEIQEKIFCSYLYPCAQGITENILNKHGYPFYKCVSRMLQGHLMLEKTLFPCSLDK